MRIVIDVTAAKFELVLNPSKRPLAGEAASRTHYPTHEEDVAVYTKSNRLIIFSLACLTLACVSGCSATALTASEPAARSANRWGDMATERQLCERLGGDDCTTCSGRPDEAACYRDAYRAGEDSARKRAAQPFALEDYVDPFAAEKSPAPGSPAMAEHIREGEATDALHLVEEQLREAVRP